MSPVNYGFLNVEDVERTVRNTTLIVQLPGI